MAVLLLAEWDKTGISAETSAACAAALKVSGSIDIVLIGRAASMAKARAEARRMPVRKVRALETDAVPEPLKTALENGLAEPVAALLAHLAEPYEAFMAAATASGKNIMPRLAGLLGVAQISDIIGVEAPNIFRRPIYAGNVVETVRALDAKKVITVRASAFAAPPAGDAPQGTEELVPCPPNLPAPARFVAEAVDNMDGRPDLGVAQIIISGGRGFGSAADFKRLLEPLAARLNAAVGASRAAVDAGFAANDRQIGQTGRTVAPRLYIAVGLSGAAQHLAGMMDSQVIVAINKDAEAPIFQVADYGVVGDLFEILPELTKILPLKKL